MASRQAATNQAEPERRRPSRRNRPRSRGSAGSVRGAANLQHPRQEHARGRSRRRRAEPPRRRRATLPDEAGGRAVPRCSRTSEEPQVHQRSQSISCSWCHRQWQGRPQGYGQVLIASTKPAPGLPRHPRKLKPDKSARKRPQRPQPASTKPEPGSRLRANSAKAPAPAGSRSKRRSLAGTLPAGPARRAG
jgi:hypothetical protein